MAEGGLPSVSPSDGDGDGIEWELGMKEAMRNYKLTSTTIDILGRGGFNSFGFIDCLDIETVSTELEKLKINRAQRCAFLSLMEARRQRLIECELEKNCVKGVEQFLSNDHSQVLRQCKPELLENLKVQDIPNLLHSDGVLTVAEYEEYIKTQPRYKKVEYLLEILEKGSQRSFLSFMRALRSTEQRHLANYIEEYVSKEGKVTRVNHIIKVMPL